MTSATGSAAPRLRNTCQPPAPKQYPIVKAGTTDTGQNVSIQRDGSARIFGLASGQPTPDQFQHSEQPTFVWIRGPELLGLSGSTRPGQTPLETFHKLQFEAGHALPEHVQVKLHHLEPGPGGAVEVKLTDKPLLPVPQVRASSTDKGQSVQVLGMNNVAVRGTADGEWNAGPVKGTPETSVWVQVDYRDLFFPESVLKPGRTSLQTATAIAQAAAKAGYETTVTQLPSDGHAVIIDRRC